MQTKKRAKPVKFGKSTKKEEAKIAKHAVRSAAEADIHSPETEELKKIVEERIHHKEELDEGISDLEEEPIEVKLSETVDDEASSEEELKEQKNEEEKKREEKNETDPEKISDEIVKPSPYGSFTNDDEQEKKHTNYVRLFFVVASITFVVGLVFIAGISYTMSVTNQRSITIPSLQSSPTPKSEAVTPTPEKIDLSAYSIKVLNGSGITGEAAKAKSSLVESGFTVSSVGNAATSDYTLTVITAKKSVNENYLTKLTDTLKKHYSVNSVIEEASSSQTTDVIVTIGSDSAK